MNEKLIEFLSQFVTEKRYELFKKVISDRTRYITVVLEDIFQPYNASAVLRTCDCFGIQDVHIIENRNEYQVNHNVAAGSAQWLNLHKYGSPKNNTLETIKTLKKSGYRIVATTPHINDTNLSNFDITKGKFALFFGSEMPGVTNTVLDNADEFLKIDMFGFTESFNISVSASIILHFLTMKLQKSEINWKLTNTEKNTIILEWLEKSIKQPELIIKRFHEEINK